MDKNTALFEPAQLYYWHPEAQKSQSEVDYIIQSSHEIYLVEVKSGTKGSIQSMHLFIREEKLRVCAGNILKIFPA
jgi:Holliday junction resolvase-like predicted endonuclease